MIKHQKREKEKMESKRPYSPLIGPEDGTE